MKQPIILGMVTLLLLTLLLPVMAEDVASPGGRIVITANKFFYYRDKNYVEYTDNVRMVDGQRVLTCARLLVYVDPQTKKMNRAEAIGSVVMTEPGRRAVAGRANYYRTEEKVILQENPVLYQDINVISGDLITFFLSSENVVVEGNVHCELYPEQLQDTAPRAPATPAAPAR
ncbi:MAG TPA: LptA/OstA family protein [bacterium]|nr:LptA/OstA family protein [bacterium]